MEWGGCLLDWVSTGCTRLSCAAMMTASTSAAWRGRSHLMWRLVLPSLVACLTASCTGTTGDAPRSSSTPSSTSAADASRLPSPPSRPPTVVEKTEHRAYPFTTVDIQRLQTTWVGTDGLSAGAPPHIPWKQPGGPHYVYRIGNKAIPIPGAVSPVGRFGDGYVAVGGCTHLQERCEGKPRSGVHLVSKDGTLTTLYRAPGGVHVCCLDISISLDGRRLAWVVKTQSGYPPYRFTRYRPYRFALGDSVPTELPDPTAGIRGASARPVGFLGEDLVLSVHRRGGRVIGYVRTSGRSAEWDARNLWVVAPRALLGKPAFSRIRDTCLSRYLMRSPHPRWTRCYTWGDRPVELSNWPVVSPNGRWLADIVTPRSGLPQALVLVDLRTGIPKRRIQFDHRQQGVRFEDESHFLVTLTREDLPGLDPWPVHRIVRCDLELHCERATPDIEINDYAMLGFMGDGED